MKQYILNAFTNKAFTGNPAAVCLLEEDLENNTLLKIAKQNNLSETAFIIERDEGYQLRWFTPGGEIDLCGHATLASAHTMLTYVHPEWTSITFNTLSGPLHVQKTDQAYQMTFPSYSLENVTVTKEMTEAIGADIKEAYLGRDLLFVLDSEETIHQLKPNQEKISRLDGLLLHVTAKGKEFDCVSRSFGPKLNLIEDPVCGSGHCHIIPYWAGVTGKTDFLAYQASERGGTLYCSYKGETTSLAGEVKLFSVGEIMID